MSGAIKRDWGHCIAATVVGAMPDLTELDNEARHEKMRQAPERHVRATLNARENRPKASPQLFTEVSRLSLELRGSWRLGVDSPQLSEEAAGETVTRPQEEEPVTAPPEKQPRRDGGRGPDAPRHVDLAPRRQPAPERR